MFSHDRNGVGVQCGVSRVGGVDYGGGGGVNRNEMGRIDRDLKA